MPNLLLFCATFSRTLLQPYHRGVDNALVSLRVLRESIKDRSLFIFKSIIQSSLYTRILHRSRIQISLHQTTELKITMSSNNQYQNVPAASGGSRGTGATGGQYDLHPCINHNKAGHNPRYTWLYGANQLCENCRVSQFSSPATPPSLRANDLEPANSVIPYNLDIPDISAVA